MSTTFETSLAAEFARRTYEEWLTWHEGHIAYLQGTEHTDDVECYRLTELSIAQHRWAIAALSRAAHAEEATT